MQNETVAFRIWKKIVAKVYNLTKELIDINSLSPFFRLYSLNDKINISDLKITVINWIIFHKINLFKFINFSLIFFLIEITLIYIFLLIFLINIVKILILFNFFFLC